MLVYGINTVAEALRSGRVVSLRVSDRIERRRIRNDVDA